MATENSNSLFHNNKERPWVPIVATLGIVFGIAVLAFGYKAMRRRNQMRSALVLNARGRRALDRDIEVAGRQYQTNRYHPFPNTVNPWTNNSPPTHLSERPGWAASGTEPGQGRVRTANRWAWASNLNPRASRREEGLNELGEAPPPYEQQNASRKEEGVPLGDLPPSRDGNTAAPTTGLSALNSPPAYNQNVVGRPAPAVLPASQRYG